STVATAVLLEAQTYVGSVAFTGVTVAVKGLETSSITKESVAGNTEIPVINRGDTVTTHVPTVTLASFAVAVIFALPSAMAVTTPNSSTVATAVLLEAQTYVGSVASAGLTVAVRVTVSLINKERVV